MASGARAEPPVTVSAVYSATVVLVTLASGSVAVGVARRWTVKGGVPPVVPERRAA